MLTVHPAPYVAQRELRADADPLRHLPKRVTLDTAQSEVLERAVRRANRAREKLNARARAEWEAAWEGTGVGFQGFLWDMLPPSGDGPSQPRRAAPPAGGAGPSQQQLTEQAAQQQQLTDHHVTLEPPPPRDVEASSPVRRTGRAPPPEALPTDGTSTSPAIAADARSVAAPAATAAEARAPAPAAAAPDLAPAPAAAAPAPPAATAAEARAPAPTAAAPDLPPVPAPAAAAPAPAVAGELLFGEVGREFSDVTLVSNDGERFYAHRLILALASEPLRMLVSKGVCTLKTNPPRIIPPSAASTALF